MWNLSLTVMLRTGISLFMCQGAARIFEPYVPLDVSAQETVLVANAIFWVVW